MGGRRDDSQEILFPCKQKLKDEIKVAGKCQLPSPLPRLTIVALTEALLSPLAHTQPSGPVRNMKVSENDPHHMRRSVVWPLI